MKKIILIMFMFVGQAFAADGVFAINDVCDNFGCFPGDTGGRPITITQSGSYKLTANLTSASVSADVIQITADNVTLDLNGFSIIGPRTCTGDDATLVCTNAGMTANAIVATGRKNIVVKNGIIQGFDTGVLLADLAQRGNIVKNINASQNEFGITVINGMISDSVANRNLDTGFNNGIFGALFINNSYAYGNKNRSAIATTCSNVYFVNNGTDNCGRYTNESTCDGFVACP